MAAITSSDVIGVGGSSTAPVTTYALPSYPATAAGQDLVVGVVIANPSVTVSSVTDTQGNTFRFRVASVNVTYVRTEIWEAQGLLASAATTVTVHLSGSTFVSAVVWQYLAVKVEIVPSPQDISFADNTSNQIGCGAAANAISSWNTCVLGFQATTAVTIKVTRGTQRFFTSSTAGGIGLMLIDVQGYATPGGFLIAGPLGDLIEGIDTLATHPWASAALELRSATGEGGTGGPVPPAAPWQPPPDGGVLVTWSYTYTVPAPPTAGLNNPTSALVTCKYLGGGCTPHPGDDQGNQAY